MDQLYSIKDGALSTFPNDIDDRLTMANLKNRKAAPDDLEAEAEKAFQRAAAQQNRNEDDEFDLEFESAFQNLPPSKADAKSDSSIKESAVSQEVSNGPSQLPIKTEGLPSSLPSSQGWEGKLFTANLSRSDTLTNICLFVFFGGFCQGLVYVYLASDVEVSVNWWVDTNLKLIILCLISPHVSFKSLQS